MQTQDRQKSSDATKNSEVSQRSARNSETSIPETLDGLPPSDLRSEIEIEGERGLRKSPDEGDDQVSIEKISMRAYEIWQEEGCPEGRAEENWIQAERELRGVGLGGLGQ